jgi:hypothetical protein
MEQLRELLTNSDEGPPWIIGDTMRSAAGFLNNVAACRVICEVAAASPRADFLIGYIMRPLHEAARQMNLEVLSFLLSLSMFDVNDCEYEESETPLYNAIQYSRFAAGRVTPDTVLAITRVLLDHGANPRQGRGRMHYKGEECPLSIAVRWNNTDIVRLLFEYRTDPNHVRAVGRRPANQLDFVPSAIRHGNADILLMLLQHGALVPIPRNRPPSHSSHNSTCLNELLGFDDKSRETKLDICRVLINHAAAIIDIGRCVAAFLRSSFEFAIEEPHNEGCAILLEVGMVPSSRDFYIAIRGGNESAARLLVQHGGDPFLLAGDDDDDDDGGAMSPFHAAARTEDTGILRVFLEHWNALFLASGGNNHDGDSALHLLCRDPLVSIQAIQVLVDELEADVSEEATTTNTITIAKNGEHVGILPFHSVLMGVETVSLDVIFFLLRQYPDVLK